MQGGGMAQVLQKGCGKEHGHPSPWGSLGVYNEGWGVPGSREAVQVTLKGCSVVERGAGSRRLGSPWGCQPCRSWPGEEQHSRPPRPSPLQCHTSTWEHCLQVCAKLGQHQLLRRGVPQIQGDGQPQRQKEARCTGVGHGGGAGWQSWWQVSSGAECNFWGLG